MQISWIVQLSIAVSYAAAWSPTNSYAPGNVSCPDPKELVRPAGQLNENEQKFVDDRLKQAMPALVNYLGRLNMTDFDASNFINDDTKIKIGMAFSGGGYRAMLAGAGQFAAFDNRTTNSTLNSNHVGGLVQASTYLAGLSGGNWLVGSIVLNNFTTIQKLQGDEDLWDLDHSIFSPHGANIFKDGKYYVDLKEEIDSKRKAGFNTSITDIWGRALSRQFIGLKKGGPALTFDDIQNYDAFKNRQMPFPIHVADGREIGKIIINLNSTVFEMTPYELGSWDPFLYSFTNMKYLGTEVQNGKPVNDQCIAGFDNAGFILGTSSTLFNQFILRLNSTGVTGVLEDFAQKILQNIGKKNDDIASYDPNPFAGVQAAGSIGTSKWLTLVDGGEDNQNVPLTPLIQPQRGVDVIFAFDNSADTTYSWPNGASLMNTYDRQFAPIGNGTAFPYVPDNNTFINLGLTKKPTFFGCDSSNLTSLFNKSLPENQRFIPPLVVYISNYAHSFLSNTSTFKMSYDTDELASMIENGYNTVTQNNGTLDQEWSACIGCAIIQRELERRNQSQSEQCKRCFSNYCWNGTLSSAEPDKDSPNAAPSVSVQSQVTKSGNKKSAASHRHLSFGATSLLIASTIVYLM